MAMDPILKEMLKERVENEALGRIFYQYVEKSDIAKKMLSELISKNIAVSKAKEALLLQKMREIKSVSFRIVWDLNPWRFPLTLNMICFQTMIRRLKKLK